jgi:hypothetical protein
MVIKFDAALFDRARAQEQIQAVQALKDVLATTDGFRAMPPAKRQDALAYVDTLAAEAAAFAFNYPVSTQKYVLILLTQSKWRQNPLFWRYAHRMIGMPDQAWRLESGVAAVYRNIVAQHFLADTVKAYIAAAEPA